MEPVACTLSSDDTRVAHPSHSIILATYNDQTHPSPTAGKPHKVRRWSTSIPIRRQKCALLTKLHGRDTTRFKRIRHLDRYAGRQRGLRVGTVRVVRVGNAFKGFQPAAGALAVASVDDVRHLAHTFVEVGDAPRQRRSCSEHMAHMGVGLPEKLL